jgi:hypothetical protein
MIVYVEYKGESYSWSYYYYDSKNFKTTTEGFKTHIVAEQHARELLGNDIELVYKHGNH